jgi:hypothetical protein
MDCKCNVELKGNLFDNLKLTEMIDEILDNGAFCEIQELKIGKTSQEESYVRVRIRAKNSEQLENVLEKIKKYGAEPVVIHSKVVEMKGHIIDSLTLSKILDIIFNNEGRCEIQDIKIGINKQELSFAKLKIITKTQKVMSEILEKISKHGAEPVEEKVYEEDLKA